MPVYQIRDVNKNERCVLFIAVPKTGNTAIHYKFLKDGWSSFYDQRFNSIIGKQKCPAQHFHAQILYSLFNIESFNDVFMVVRNPYRRIISDYLWFTRNCNDLERPKFDAWLPKVLNLYLKNPFVGDNHLRPQIEYLVKGTRVFRYEDGLHNIVKDVYNKVGFIDNSNNCVGNHNTSRENTGFNVNDINPSRNSLELIKKFYYKDFQHFNYSLDYEEFKNLY